MATNSLYKVFVYGTLKKGEPNHQWFSKDTDGHHKFLYNGRTKEKFPLIIATRFNIPFILYAPGKGYKVKGEVYEVDEKVLKNLDILEDHPNYYIREQYDVEPVDSQSQTSEKVWIYMMKTFKKDLLNGTFYENYSNNGDHGLKYVPRYLRGDTDDHKRQLTSENKDE